LLIENNYKQRNIKVANEIIKKISYEFGGSELDLIRDTIIEELNNDCKTRYLDMVDNFSTHIVNNIVSFHKDKVNFDYVFNKYYLNHFDSYTDFLLDYISYYMVV
jgi:hypothetical protein